VNHANVDADRMDFASQDRLGSQEGVLSVRQFDPKLAIRGERQPIKKSLPENRNGNPGPEAIVLQNDSRNLSCWLIGDQNIRLPLKGPETTIGLERSSGD
jgi:hypothetical protein